MNLVPKNQDSLAQYLSVLTKSLKKRLALYRRELMYRQAANVDRELLARARRQFESAFAREKTPLISVTIATYNRGELLANRTLPSVLNSTHGNFEIVIVGDGCTDDTAAQIERLRDSRIRFMNLPQRGNYPEDARIRWMVAGVPPINRALNEARGSWIAHLDDDDIFEPDHLEKLLNFAQDGDLEFAYSQMEKQTGTETWEIIGEEPTDRWRVPHSSAFFRSYLKAFKFDINAWKYGITADRQVWARMSRVGVRVGFLKQITTTSPLRPGTTSHKWLASDRD